jgi:LacI family transcriptional regulator
LKKVSLKDLAEILGVSKTLISLVLNNKGDTHGISPETQKRVFELARKLNYKPNLLARGLRTGKSNIIGLIVADISNSFYSRIARSIEDKVRQHGFHLMVCSSDEDAERERELFRVLKDEQQVNGIIVSTTQDDFNFFNQLKKEGFPFVLIDRYIQKFQPAQVLVNNMEGSSHMVSFLLEKGYRKIGLLSISPTHLSSIRDRIKGYKNALLAHGINPDPQLMREIPFNNIFDGVRKELKHLVSEKVKADAVFLLNNNLALAFLEAAKQENLKIPNDIAMVSFDDIEAFKISDPPITSVSQPMEKIGELSVERLMELIANPLRKTLPTDILPTEMVVRASTR